MVNQCVIGLTLRLRYQVVCNKDYHFRDIKTDDLSNLEGVVEESHIFLINMTNNLR